MKIVKTNVFGIGIGYVFKIKVFSMHFLIWCIDINI